MRGRRQTKEDERNQKQEKKGTKDRKGKKRQKRINTGKVVLPFCRDPTLISSRVRDVLVCKGLYGGFDVLDRSTCDKKRALLTAPK